jgi:hypothetical protein
METTYFQKLILAVILGAVVAGGVRWFETFVTGADDAINAEFRELPED